MAEERKVILPPPVIIDPVDDGYCPRCYPLGCDCSDAQRPEAVPPEYTPLRNRGCRCGADFDGRDCMCFEDY